LINVLKICYAWPIHKILFNEKNGTNAALILKKLNIDAFILVSPAPHFWIGLNIENDNPDLFAWSDGTNLVGNMLTYNKNGRMYYCSMATAPPHLPTWASAAGGRGY